MARNLMLGPPGGKFRFEDRVALVLACGSASPSWQDIKSYVFPREPLRDESPFGDHTVSYTLREPYPAFHVIAITHRKDTVHPATIVEHPPEPPTNCRLRTVSKYCVRTSTFEQRRS